MEAMCGAGFRALSKTPWFAGWCVMERCLPAPTSSTCLCQGAPCNVASTRRQHPNVALLFDANALFDEARRENDAVHHRSTHQGAWNSLAALVDAHMVIEICLSCGPFVGSNHPNWTVLCWSLVERQRERGEERRGERGETGRRR